MMGRSNKYLKWHLQHYTNQQQMTTLKDDYKKSSNNIGEKVVYLHSCTYNRKRISDDGIVEIPKHLKCVKLNKVNGQNTVSFAFLSLLLTVLYV